MKKFLFLSFILPALAFAQPVPSTNVTYTASGTGAVSQTLSTVLNRTVNIDDYGAAGDGTTNDSAPLANAMASLGTPGGTVFLDCAKNYAILSNVTIPANVTVQQCRGGEPWGNPGVDWASSPIASQPHINLSSSATIRMSSNSGFTGVILRSGMSIPVQTPAAYAGTAISLSTGGTNDVQLHALIVGFATCVDGSNGGDRQRWSIECDGNASSGTGAVIIGPSYDTSRITARVYPWGTVAASSPTLTRTGIGIQILAGNQDDSRLDLMDFGTAEGIVSSANGNVHYTHIWVDNNSTYGAYFTANDNSAFDAIYSWTGKGVVFAGNAAQNIAFMYCNQGAVSGSFCIATLNNDTVNIANLYANNTGSGYAINIGSTTSHVNVSNAKFSNINQSMSGPQVAGVSGWTSDQVRIGTLITDLVPGASVFGGNVQTLPLVASAATLGLPAGYDHFMVTGTTNINNITGTWNDRRILLTFNNTNAIINGGNVALSGGTNFSAGNGSTIALWYNQATNQWLEMWRH